MRFLIAVPFAMIAGCTAPTKDVSNETIASPETIDNTMTRAPGVAMRGDEPATSASAREATAVVERYFSLIKQRQYDKALLLWGNGGADFHATEAEFAATFAPFRRFAAEVGAPSAIKESGGMQYILVETKLTATMNGSGRISHQTGTVMLKRSSNPEEPSPDKKEWRIWGTDLRERH